ncbi:DUF3267 domain-containing protein [Candidatus Dependentiae bacterium]|nr:DUF3267 domain-containing protein [Candidatus Dependentiae bacterium]
MIFIIPGFLVSMLTFPGVILHEMAHKFFCDYYNITVFKVAYFRISSKAGHVTHEPIYDKDKETTVALAPFFINSLICMLFFIPYFLIYSFGTFFLWKISRLDVFLIWVGISCGLSAVPSETDLKHIPKDISGIYFFFRALSKGLNDLGFFGSMLWTFMLGCFCYMIAIVIGNIFY